MKKRRPIADVRAEIRMLENELTHVVIAEVASEKFNKSEEMERLRNKINALKEEYPRWELRPRAKL